MRKCVSRSELLSGSLEPMIEYLGQRNRFADGGDSSPPLVLENLKWFTSREAVVYLRLPSYGALRNLVYRRKIPFVKLGRSLRFNREELDRLLESSQRHGHHERFERRIA
jgi:excisionase family DNA binding protein